jgi:predicted ArsR family transcriptional regulator
VSPQPLRIRILRALELSPMTVRDLARCLSASEGYIRDWMCDLEKVGDVECVGIDKPISARPWNVYGLA